MDESSHCNLCKRSVGDHSTQTDLSAMEDIFKVCKIRHFYSISVNCKKFFFSDEFKEFNNLHSVQAKTEGFPHFLFDGEGEH